jgi:hypothetical protein
MTTDPATSEAVARAIKDAISRIQTSNTGYIGHMQALSNTLPSSLLNRISEEAARVAIPPIEAAALERAAQVAEEFVYLSNRTVAAEIRALKEQPAESSAA